MQLHKVILGHHPWIDLAAEDWLLAEPRLSLTLIEVSMDRSYLFDLSALDDLHPLTSTGFVAWGPKFLNFQRMELMGALKKRGFKMPALLHPSAQVSSTAKYQENTWIRAQAVIGPLTTIGMNTHIDIGARLGLRSQLANHAWLGQNVILGDDAKVGTHTVLGDGVKVGNFIRIGRQANIEVPGLIDEDLPDKSFHFIKSSLQGKIIDYSAIIKSR